VIWWRIVLRFSVVLIAQRNGDAPLPRCVTGLWTDGHQRRLGRRGVSAPARARSSSSGGQRDQSVGLSAGASRHSAAPVLTTPERSGHPRSGVRAQLIGTAARAGGRRWGGHRQEFRRTGCGPPPSCAGTVCDWAAPPTQMRMGMGKKRLALGGSAAGEGLRKPGHYHHLATAVVAQAGNPTVAAEATRCARPFRYSGCRCGRTALCAHADSKPCRGPRLDTQPRSMLFV
jgi:hypothetical protein